MTVEVIIEAATGRSVDRQQFGDLTNGVAGLIGSSVKKWLYLLIADNRIDAIVALKGLVQAGQTVLVVDPGLALHSLQELIELYRPEAVICRNGRGDIRNLALENGFAELEQCLLSDSAIFTRAIEIEPLHPDLAILLMTSGSTGSARMVRLSLANLAVNTRDIIEALDIRSHDRVAAHMPLAYSYGLSVLMTHIAAGASVVLFEDGLASAGFWRGMRQHGVTTLPGVPYHFSLLRRLDIEQLDVPALHTMTQAGGRMDPDLVVWFASVLQKRGGRFFVMYGQTEAAPRMTVLPAGQSLIKPESVGLPLAHGRLEIEDGEVVYYGPNVMMGYAENRADLVRGNDMQGRLPTGDLGSLDPDGFLCITGRKKRFAKIDGLRINLDDIERLAKTIAPAVGIEHQEQLVLFTTGEPEAVRSHVLAHARLHPSRVACRAVTEFPRLANYKIDEHMLRKALR